MEKVKVRWTETWAVEHELGLPEALAFVNAHSEPELPDTATLAEVVEALEGLDLPNELAQIDMSDWTYANVERTDIEVEQC